MDNTPASNFEGLHQPEIVRSRTNVSRFGLAALVASAALTLNACGGSADNSSDTIAAESSTTSANVYETILETTTSSIPAEETTEVTSIDTASAAETVPEVLLPEKQYLALELPDYEIGERMGYIAIDGIVLTQLFQADDGLSTENPFVDYVEEGAAAWGGELKPGNSIKNTMVIGGHRTAEGAPFNKLQEVKKGDELVVVFQTGDSYNATDVATLKYVTQMDAPVQITQYDVDLVTKQLETPSVRLFTCNSLDFRLIVDFELVSVENTVDN
jgi:LPXTG-site transpeptidase (sortase) family protein